MARRRVELILVLDIEDDSRHWIPQWKSDVMDALTSDAPLSEGYNVHEIRWRSLRWLDSQTNRKDSWIDEEADVQPDPG